MLNPDVLNTEIRKINDQSFEHFEGFPADNTAVGARWAHAVRVFFDGLDAPVLLPPTLDLAEQAFASSLTAALSAAVGPVAAAGIAAFPIAFDLFAKAVASGVVTPAALPPPAPPVFALPPLPPQEASVVAAVIAGVVFAWAKTGLWGPLPSPPASPWA